MNRQLPRERKHREAYNTTHRPAASIGMTTPIHNRRDPTFVTYTDEQACQYATGRGSSYSAELYEEILTYHQSNGGKMHKLLDLGCGTGKVLQDLGPLFDDAIGIDPSQAMVDQAQSQGYQAREGPVMFEVGSAEDFDTLNVVEPSSIDLLTVAMAAHWFDMEKFWPKAASMLVPGGTVAMWTYASSFCHPATPNAEAVQQILFDLEYGMLGPYTVPGNIISQQMYDTLKLPWQIQHPVAEFQMADYVRKEWNRNGRLGEGKIDFMTGETTTLEELEKSLSTASMVTRWREASSNFVGTEQDCVKLTIQRLRNALDGANEITLGHGVVSLCFKKRTLWRNEFEASTNMLTD